MNIRYQHLMVTGLVPFSSQIIQIEEVITLAFLTPFAHDSIGLP
ncbi:hypothetical protein P4V64_25160 [Bacillus thuringiensis]|nr:hypothetical protein [Bacillus thuringiensis]